MTVPPNDGAGPPPPPPPPPGSGGPGLPPPPPPMPGGPVGPGQPVYGQPAYGQPVYGQIPPKKTSLPLVSFIFGLLILCIPLIAGVVAVITGFIGRKKAKQLGQGTGLAVAGIVLGFLGIVITIVAAVVMAIGGFAFIGAVSGQYKVAEQLQKATAVADQYAASTGSYEGLTSDKLVAQGYVPVAGIQVTPVVQAGGTAICMEGSETGSGNSQIHMPTEAGEVRLNITINNKSVWYALGPCGTG